MSDQRNWWPNYWGPVIVGLAITALLFAFHKAWWLTLAATILWMLYGIIESMRYASRNPSGDKGQKDE